jgi:hypothetical protein
MGKYEVLPTYVKTYLIGGDTTPLSRFVIDLMAQPHTTLATPDGSKVVHDQITHSELPSCSMASDSARDGGRLPDMSVRAELLASNMSE